MEKLNIKYLKFNNNALLRSLDFYRIELGFMQERLQEIATDNTGRDVAIKINYFEDQLIIHREQLDILKHRVHEIEDAIKQQEIPSSVFIEKECVEAAEKLADDFATEETIFSDLRKAFNRFAAEWM